VTSYFDAKVSRIPYDKDMFEKISQVFIEVKNASNYMRLYDVVKDGCNKEEQKFKTLK